MKDSLKITLSSRYSRSPEKLYGFLHDTGLDGIEYTINAQDDASLEAERSALLALAELGVPVWHHLQFNRLEMAHRDAAEAAEALRHHKRCIDLVSRAGGSHVIVHLCLGYLDRLELMNRENARNNLASLVEYAAPKGVTVCLENLRGGLVSTPEDFLDFIDFSGASATIDIGHVAASPCVRNGSVSAEEYIALLGPRLLSAHIYDIELTDVGGKAWHKAPDSAADLAPRIHELLKAAHCDWWLIELGDPEEINRTAGFLREISAQAPPLEPFG